MSEAHFTHELVPGELATRSIQSSEGRMRLYTPTELSLQETLNEHDRGTAISELRYATSSHSIANRFLPFSVNNDI
jgi:hypothetical protein